MSKDKDDKKRNHLRLVVNNPDKRKARPAPADDNFVPLPDLATRRDELRPRFYEDLSRRHFVIYAGIERRLAELGSAYGLDPFHGKMIVAPVSSLSPEAVEAGALPDDEVLIYVQDELSGDGLCLTIEMTLPFYSEDETVMEDSVLFSPVLQYGMLFLEENPQDGFLDLIYRAGFPLFAPVPSRRYVERILASAGYEIAEMLKSLYEYPEGSEQ